MPIWRNVSWPRPKACQGLLIGSQYGACAGASNLTYCIDVAIRCVLLSLILTLALQSSQLPQLLAAQLYQIYLTVATLQLPPPLAVCSPILLQLDAAESTGQKSSVIHVFLL